MKKTLYMMRHGETLFNLRHKIQGACDSPLTENGIAQAKKVAPFVRSLNIDHAYSSSAERASDTLEHATEHRMPYTRLKALKEMNFGTFEGESEDLNPKRGPGFDNFFVPYGGESRHNVRERMVKALTDIMEKDDHQNVFVVSHAGATMTFTSHWHDVDEVLPKRLPNGTILRWSYENKQFTLEEAIYQDQHD